MIPVCEPDISQSEIDNVVDCLQSGWISSQGKYIQEMEETFAAFHGVKHAVALSNGTAALEVALHSLGIGPGDEVIIPSFTIISVAVAVIRLGGVPRFVDVDENTWNIKAELVERQISKKTRAIIVVHSFGHPAEMKNLCDIAAQHDLKIIEDTAEAIASRYAGKLCGTFGDIATFSLYANKLITTGEGGVLITDNDEYAAKARQYINLYFGESERFSHAALGFNYRMTNLQAAVGVAQMKRINDFIKKKVEIGHWYAEALQSSRSVNMQKTIGDIEHVYWMYCVLLKEGIQHNAASAMKHLKNRGIGSRQLFKGLHLQEPLRKYRSASEGSFEVTERLYQRGFYLPSGINITQAQVGSIVDALEELA